MSEINNIKTSGQPTLNTTRNVNANNSGFENSQGVQANETRPDKVSLTDTATQIQSLQKTISGASEVNKERVEELRAAVEDGSYKVDASELAKNMINFEQQL
ncbi:MAG: flagellar biosynthesis anti-sigma factor FlgM [Gammaproteobacteria bacterium]|nr:flagellar biosynthesis anti-sigma factor FlgM [Gammaproteobacteria bacterium]MDH5592168.1 flagellar biosynthesis anti-sigma factor FlgM [Gammaproteobacteria bacterium]